MSDVETFIGRQHEIAMIEEMIFDPLRRNHILPILGPGGVGKTWLLRALHRRFVRHPDMLVIRIEFAEVRSASIPTLTFDIFKQFSGYFSPEERDEFQARLANWEYEATKDADSPGANEAEEAIYQFGFELITRMIQREDRRLLILSDTLESVKSLDLADRINSLASNMPNSVIVVVGRPSDEAREICRRYHEIYYGWTVHPVYELKPFAEQEAESYYRALLPVQIDPGLQRKIYLLTGGSPILIAITGEWLRRNVDLPPDLDLPLDTLEAMYRNDTKLLNKFQRRFEFGLIDRIRTLGQQIDIATLYLAYVNRRNDPRLIRLILNVDDDAELDALMAQLGETVFVRKSMSSDGGLLHDEAQRLILEHAWPIIDPEGDMRRTLARKVIDGFYMPEIDRLREIVRRHLQESLSQSLASGQESLPPIPEEDWEKRDLQIECLDYQFRLSEADGWAYLEDLFEEALSYQYSFIQMDQIVGAVYNLAPRQASSPRFRVRVAQILLRKGDLAQARAIAEEVLNAPKVRQQDAVAALMVLGDAALNPQTRIAYYTNALTRAEGMSHKTPLARVYDSLGRAYQQQGRWHQATDAFHVALQRAEPQVDIMQYAQILNHLARVHALRGDLDLADTLATVVGTICHRLADDRGLALAYATRGMVAERRGDYQQALRHFRTAGSLAGRVNDSDNLALYQVLLAAAELCLAHTSNARRYLQPGLESHSVEVRQLAHLQMGRLILSEAPPGEPISEATLQQIENARAHLQQALDLAGESGHQHMVVMCLMELLLLGRRRDGRVDPAAMHGLNEILEHYSFPVEQGRLTELYGDIHFERGHVERAFGHYLDACLILEQAGTTLFRPTLERVRERLLSLNAENAEAACGLLRTRLGSATSSATATLLAVCSYGLPQLVVL